MIIRPIYLDYAATTPMDPRVYSAINPYLKEEYGNAASTTHNYGKIAKLAVERASVQIAELINADPKEVIYTSGATESINLALKGYFEANRNKGNHFITCKTEHKAMLDTLAYLEGLGARVTYLPVDQYGLVDVNLLEESITDQTIMISIMWANNETGVLQDIEKIGKIAQANGIAFLTDATQAVGKIPVDVLQTSISMMAFSAHKLYGPKGVGALYIKKGLKVAPLIHGGGHQRGYRSGTLNVPGIVGFGEACAICEGEMDEEFERILMFREQLEFDLLDSRATVINGCSAPRLPNISNIQFKGLTADELILKWQKDIAVSTGSACTSAVMEPSHVLSAMGLDRESANSSVRFSVGRFTTEDQISSVQNFVNERYVTN